MLHRRYMPEEFHGLSSAEADEMTASQLSRQEWDRSNLCRAHGDLCAALIHLRKAEGYFVKHHPQVGAVLAPLARQLSEHVPSYGEFYARMIQTRRPGALTR